MMQTTSKRELAKFKQSYVEGRSGEHYYGFNSGVEINDYQCTTDRFNQNTLELCGTDFNNYINKQVKGKIIFINILF